MIRHANKGKALNKKTFNALGFEEVLIEKSPVLKELPRYCNNAYLPKMNLGIAEKAIVVANINLGILYMSIDKSIWLGSNSKMNANTA